MNSSKNVAAIHQHNKSINVDHKSRVWFSLYQSFEIYESLSYNQPVSTAFMAGYFKRYIFLGNFRLVLNTRCSRKGVTMFGRPWEFWKDFIPIALGAIGTILGIYNIVRDVKKSKENINLRVYPGYQSVKGIGAITKASILKKNLEQNEPSHIVFFIHNKSFIPATVHSFGIAADRSFSGDKYGMLIDNTVTAPTIEAHKSLQVNLAVSDQMIKMSKNKGYKYGVVDTITEKRFSGTTRSFKKLCKYYEK